MSLLSLRSPCDIARRPQLWKRAVSGLAIVTLGAVGCATPFSYEPERLAKAEMTVRAAPLGVSVLVGGREVASSLSLYSGFETSVQCVARARRHAQRARISQGIGLGLSILTGIFGLSTFVAVAKQGLDNYAFATGVLTGITLGGSLALRHRALGHTIDAMNYYNDQVGSLGASCAAQSYPQSLPLPFTVSSSVKPSCSGAADDSPECTKQSGGARVVPDLAAATSAQRDKPTRTINLKQGGVTVPLRIAFGAGNNQILAKARQQLDEVADAMKRFPTMRILIAGHSDARGSEAEQQRMSQLRASAVQLYLVDHGIAEDRLSAKGFGASRPLCSAASMACDEQNRRVDFTILTLPD